MNTLLTRSFVRAAIIVVASALIIVGGVYAEQTLWSGQVLITIETPSGEAQVVVTGVSVTAGSYDYDADVWTLSIPRGGDAYLRVYLRNDGGDAVLVNGVVEGQAHSYQVDGVHFSAGNVALAAGESDHVFFHVEVAVDAEPGQLPAIQLEIRL